MLQTARTKSTSHTKRYMSNAMTIQHLWKYAKIASTPSVLAANASVKDGDCSKLFTKKQSLNSGAEKNASGVCND